MKKFKFYSSLFVLLTASSLKAETSGHVTKYFNYIKDYGNVLGPLGNAEKGEIEIILDEEKIQEVSDKMGRKVGVVAEDKYWIWLNDVVKFPKGNYGIYARHLWRQSLNGSPGVAVLPVLPNGKIVLNCNYRHATRSWEYELPRGGVLPNESPQMAALREVQEETGMHIETLLFLGKMASDSGLTNSIVPVFFAKVSEQGVANPEDTEAIEAVVSFSLEEIKQGFIHGYLRITREGKTCKIPLRDPFLAFALFQSEIRGLFSRD